MNKEVINDLYNRLYVLEQRVFDIENTPLPFKDNTKEQCFAYQNKKNQKWLKIFSSFDSSVEDYVYFAEAYDSFDRYVMYSVRNLIEKDFSRTKLVDKEDWQLMKIEIEYNISVAKL